MKRRSRNTRMRAGPIIFFVGFCICGTAAGILINNHYYAIEKAQDELMRYWSDKMRGQKGP
jgi:hypothetical protein